MHLKNLAVLIMLFHSISLAGQPYFSSTSLWKQYLRYDSPPDNVYTEDAFIQFDGDTLIGNVLYYKVLKTGMETAYYLQQGDTAFHRPVYKYMNPVREEGQFIYAFDISTGHEYLLYDFSAEIGDTLLAGNCKQVPVTSIDNVYLGDDPRRRFHFPHMFAEISTLVEGIGSTAGFYRPVCNNIPSVMEKLQCYSQDGDFIQFDLSYDCGSLILADERIQDKTFFISPNPFRDEFQIHFLSEISTTASINIVSLLGEIMFQKVIQSPELIEQLNVSFLPSGIYVLLIRDKAGYATEKIIKL